MLTTAAASAAKETRDSGLRMLVRVAVVSAFVGLVVTVLAALLSGSEAAGGALVGTALVVGIFSFGAFSVHMVSEVMPSASLLVALVTYTLQVVLMLLAFVALNTSGALDDGLDPLWLGCTVIVGTFCWLVVQVILTMRRRIPVYDLPDGRSPAPTGTGDE